MSTNKLQAFVSSFKQEPLPIDQNLLTQFQHCKLSGFVQASIEPVTSLEPGMLQQAFLKQKSIPIDLCLDLLARATETLRSEPNIVQLTAPVIVCGDLHGQLYDLLHIFNQFGPPGSGATYLFLGDYVDRGAFSCEIMLMLLSYKLSYPNHIFLLRGNHECRSVSQHYGFEQECRFKYGPHVYNRFMTCFQALPLTGIVETNYGAYLALHGGLSPDFALLSDLNKMNRLVEPEENQMICDILWSDPEKNASTDQDWAPNHARGVSYLFSMTATREFLARNELIGLIRAHEVEDRGFFAYYDPENTKIPAVLTVFSAHNYCGNSGNHGATLHIGKELDAFKIKQHSQLHNPTPRIWASEWKAIKQSLKTLTPYLPRSYHSLVSCAKTIGPAPEIDWRDSPSRRLSFFKRRRPSVAALEGKKTVKQMLKRLEPHRFFKKQTISTDPDIMAACELHNLKVLFTLYDRQGTGFVTEQDLSDLAQEEDAYAAASEVKSCMEALDADGDGQIGQADFVQFAIRLKRQQYSSSELPIIA